MSYNEVRFPIEYGTELIEGVTLLDEVNSVDGRSLVFDQRKWTCGNGLFRMFDNAKVIRLTSSNGGKNAQ